MGRTFVIGAVMAAAGAVAGCASTDNTSTASILNPGTASALTADEQALECKQLTGRMQIRILEIRDYNERTRTTMASRALQTGVTTVFGGTNTGLDPSGAYAKDRAMLEAYNKQLAAKGCKSYDLQAELQPHEVQKTPSATIKPAAGQVDGSRATAAEAR